jgi:hypothetical protein
MFLKLALQYDKPCLIWYSNLLWSNDFKEKFGITAYYLNKQACFNMCMRDETIKRNLYNRLAFHMALDGRETEIIDYLDSYDNVVTAFNVMMYDNNCTEDRLIQFVNNLAQYSDEFRQISLTQVVRSFERGFIRLFKLLLDHEFVDLSAANSSWILSHLYVNEAYLDMFLAAGPQFSPLVLKMLLNNLSYNNKVMVCTKILSNPVKIENSPISGPTRVIILDNGQLHKPQNDIWNIVVEENMEKDILRAMTKHIEPHIMARKVALLAPMCHIDILENIGYWCTVDTLFIHQQVFWNKLQIFTHIQEQKNTE